MSDSTNSWQRSQTWSLLCSSAEGKHNDDCQQQRSTWVNWFNNPDIFTKPLEFNELCVECQCVNHWMTCFPITAETLWAPRFFNIKFINNLSGTILLQFGVSKPFWSSIFYPDTFILVRTNLNFDKFGAHQTEGNIYRFDVVYTNLLWCAPKWRLSWKIWRQIAWDESDNLVVLIGKQNYIN